MLSPTEWDAAEQHMTPLSRSWTGVLGADPVMQQNMTLPGPFFPFLPFFVELAALLRSDMKLRPPYFLYR